MAEIDPRFLRFRDAYLQIARLVNYRPQAPSDGFCNIRLSLDELRDPDQLQVEAREYAIRFLKEEDTDSFWTFRPPH